MKQTFKKSERLTSKKTFEQLFNKGKSFVVSPFRIVYVLSNEKFTKLAISVPKKNFPRAADRNKIKRRIREAYRKNKHLLYEILKEKNLTLALMFIYTFREETSYQEIEKKMVVSLHKLISELK